MKRMSKKTRALLGGGIVFLLVFTLPGAAAAQVCVPPPPGLVSWWPGDGNADDIQGGNDGTLMNGTTFAPGKVGQAFSFDGVNDAVVVPNASSLNFGAGADLSIDAWIKANVRGTESLPELEIQSIVEKRLAPTALDQAIGYTLFYLTVSSASRSPTPRYGPDLLRPSYRLDRTCVMGTSTMSR